MNGSTISGLAIRACEQAPEVLPVPQPINPSTGLPSIPFTLRQTGVSVFDAGSTMTTHLANISSATQAKWIFKVPKVDTYLFLDYVTLFEVTSIHFSSSHLAETGDWPRLHFHTISNSFLAWLVNLQSHFVPITYHGRLQGGGICTRYLYPIGYR